MTKHSEASPTLIHLLEESAVKLRLYDMGRRVRKVSRKHFLQFEHAQAGWPAPLMRQAWFGMLIESEDDAQQMQIWFLHLPLDEQAKLVQPSRDYFLQRLLEAWRYNQQQSDTSQLQDALKDNPCTFKPREERLAVFHAKVSLDLNREPSRFYAHAQDYFDGKPGWDQWSFVGYQGIADIAARHAQQEQRIAAALPHLPPEPLAALCHCLENERVPHSIAAPLAHRLKRQLHESKPDTAQTAALLRALSDSSATAIRKRAFESVLQHQKMANDIEVLAAISARAWEQLLLPEYAQMFLSALAGERVGQRGFDQLLQDLLFIPGVRDVLLKILKQSANNSAVVKRFEIFKKSAAVQAQ